MSEFGLDVAAVARPERARAEAYAALYSALEETSQPIATLANSRPVEPSEHDAAIVMPQAAIPQALPSDDLVDVSDVTFGTRDHKDTAVLDRPRTIPQGGQALARSLRAQLKAEPPVPAEPPPDSLQTFLAMARAAVRRKAGEEGTPDSGATAAPFANPNGARDRLARLKARLSEPTSDTTTSAVAPAPALAPKAAPVAPVPTESVALPVKSVAEVAAQAMAAPEPTQDDTVANNDLKTNAPVTPAQISPLPNDVMFIEDASVPLVMDQAPLPLTSSASIETVTSPPVAPLRSSEQSAMAGYVPPAPISQPEQAPRASLGPTWSGTAVLKSVPAERIVTFSFADLPDIQRERARAAVQRSMLSQPVAVEASPMPRWIAVSLAAFGGLCVFGMVFGLHFALR